MPVLLCGWHSPFPLAEMQQFKKGPTATIHALELCPIASIVNYKSFHNASLVVKSRSRTCEPTKFLHPSISLVPCLLIPALCVRFTQACTSQKPYTILGNLRLDTSS